MESDEGPPGVSTNSWEPSADLHHKPRTKNDRELSHSIIAGLFSAANMDAGRA